MKKNKGKLCENIQCSYKIRTRISRKQSRTLGLYQRTCRNKQYINLSPYQGIIKSRLIDVGQNKQVSVLSDKDWIRLYPNWEDIVMYFLRRRMLQSRKY
jgi:hypothetical protein